MADQHEFGSPGWIQATCEIFETAIRDSGVDLAGMEYCFGEEFTNVPERLMPPGEERVGWVVTIRDGKAEARPTPPPPDADAVNVADWDAIEWTSHVILGEDPQRDAEMQAAVRELIERGKLRMDVRRRQPRELDSAFKPLHNAIAAITGPRAD